MAPRFEKYFTETDPCYPLQVMPALGIPFDGIRVTIL